MKRTHYLLSIILFTIYMLCLSAMAMAAELGVTEVTPFNSFVTNTVQPLILSLMATVVTVAVAYLSGMLKKKFGIEISNATNDRISGIAFDAVHVVEERAAETVKAGGEKWLGASKHAEAVNYILARVPALSQRQADDLVQTSISQIKGLGATPELGN